MNQERKLTLQRILNSPTFITSFRAKKLLTYLVEKSTANCEEDYSSYAIALEVFEREDDFDPSIDPIVRVQMGRLRGLLSKYYLNDAIDNDIIIEIPKGKYIPTFTPTVKEVDVTDFNIQYPQIYIDSIIKSNNEKDTVLRSLQMKLYERFYNNAFYKITLNAQKSDYQLKVLWSDQLLKIFVFDKEQCLITIYEAYCEDETSVLEMIQLYIDGFYSPLLLTVGDTVFKTSIFEQLLQFDKEILENHRYEILSEAVTILEKIHANQQSDFLLELLIKYYHFDYHYSLQIYDNNLKRAEKLFPEKLPLNLYSEKIWAFIYQGKEKEAYSLYQLFIDTPKHYEGLCQEILFHAYFCNKEQFEISFTKIQSLTIPIPNVLMIAKAIFLILEDKLFPTEVELALDLQPFYFPILLLSLGAKDAFKREKSKQVLEEFLEESNEELKYYISNWVHQKNVDFFLKKYSDLK